MISMLSKEEKWFQSISKLDNRRVIKQRRQRIKESIVYMASGNTTLRDLHCDSNSVNNIMASNQALKEPTSW